MNFKNLFLSIFCESKSLSFAERTDDFVDSDFCENFANNNKKIDFIKNILFINLLLLIFAPIKIFLPFTPIPVVFRNSVIIFSSIFFGSKTVLPVLLFIVEGIFLNFFGGVSIGYVFGYFAASIFVGFLADKRVNIWINVLIGNLTIYFFGALWLAQFVGTKNALLLGVLTFVPVDIFKSLLIVKAVKIFKKC